MSVPQRLSTAESQPPSYASRAGSSATHRIDPAGEIELGNIGPRPLPHERGGQGPESSPFNFEFYKPKKNSRKFWICILLGVILLLLIILAAVIPTVLKEKPTPALVNVTVTASTQQSTIIPVSTLQTTVGITSETTSTLVSTSLSVSTSFSTLETTMINTVPTTLLTSVLTTVFSTVPTTVVSTLFSPIVSTQPTVTIVSTLLASVTSQETITTVSTVFVTVVTTVSVTPTRTPSVASSTAASPAPTLAPEIYIQACFELLSGICKGTDTLPTDIATLYFGTCQPILRFFYCADRPRGEVYCGDMAPFCAQFASIDAPFSSGQNNGAVPTAVLVAHSTSTAAMGASSTSKVGLSVSLSAMSSSTTETPKSVNGSNQGGTLTFIPSVHVSINTNPVTDTFTASFDTDAPSLSQIPLTTFVSTMNFSLTTVSTIISFGGSRLIPLSTIVSTLSGTFVVSSVGVVGSGGGKSSTSPTAGGVGGGTSSQNGSSANTSSAVGLGEGPTTSASTASASLPSLPNLATLVPTL